jgi:hypothetical protein
VSEQARVRYDIYALGRVVDWCENRYRALSEEAQRRMDGGPFCRVPIGDKILEVFILGGAPTQREINTAIDLLTLMRSHVTEDDAPPPATYAIAPTPKETA